jgi:predicted dehydrogenase
VSPLRFGILGTGQMAAAFAAELGALRERGIIAAAVGSRSLTQAQRFAAAYGIERAHGSYAALAADPAVDVAYIATPHVFHEAHALLCLQSGKHVLCEKPLAINALAADRMIAGAHANGRFLMEALWTRFLPAVQAARELVARGALGRLRLMVGGGAFIPVVQPQQYLLRHDLGGGALLDAGTYFVSLASALAGPALRVKALGALGATGVDEQDAWLSEHAEGVQAIGYVSLHAQRAPDLEILAEDGRILLHAPVFCPTRLTLSRPDQPDEIRHYPIERSGYGYQALEVQRCIAAGLSESPLMPLAESRAVLTTMDDIRAQLGLRYPGE